MRQDERARDEPSTLRRALAIAGVVDVVLVGSSMAPLIGSGARARVVRCRLDEVSRYDVVVFVREGRHVAHLVAAIDASGPLTAALGSSDLDAPLREHEMLGRVEGLVVRRVHLRRVPRALARAVVFGAHRAIRSMRR